MKKNFWVGLILLTSCAAPSGDSGKTPTPTPSPTPTLVSTLVSDQKNTFFGVLSPGQSKSKVITLTNKGTKKTSALSLSTISNSNFTLSDDSCSGQELVINGQCSVKVSFSHSTENSYTGNFNVLGATNTLNIKVGAMVKDIPEMLEGNTNPSFLLSIVLAEQQSDGSWQNGSLSFDLGTTLFVAESLALSKEKLGITTELYSNSFGLDKTLAYLETTTAGGGGVRAIDFSADVNTVIPEWARALPSGGMKLKEISPYFISIADYLHDQKDGSSSSSYTFYNSYLDNRRQASSAANAAAQYAYIWDKNRWNAFYGSGFVSSSYTEIVENAYKDTLMLLKSLLREGKQTQFNQVADLAYKHFLYNSTDLSTTFGIVPKYSSVEFVHSSFTNANFDMTLSDYYNSCRQLSYGIQILALIHDHATNLDPLDKDDMYYTNINYFWIIMKNDYYSQLSSMDDIEKTRCIPMMAQAVAAIPNRNLVLPTEATNIYQALFDLIADDVAISNISGFPLEGAEALRALVDGVNYNP